MGGRGKIVTVFVKMTLMLRHRTTESDEYHIIDGFVRLQQNFF